MMENDDDNVDSCDISKLLLQTDKKVQSEAILN